METPLMGIPVPFSNWSWPFDNFHHSTSPQGFHIYWAVGACGPGQHRTRLPNGEELCWGTENPLPASTSLPPSAEQLCNENSFPRFEIQWPWESVVLNKNGSKNLGSFKDLPKNITHCPGSKGNCPIAIQIALNNSVRFGCPPKGLWWLCGDGYARKTLPESWGGACTVGALAPILSMHDRTNPLTGYLRTPWKRVGRALNPLVEKPTSFHSFVRWFIPFLGVSELEKAIVNISATLEIIENATIDAIRGLQTEVSTLSKVVLQNRMALDLLSAKEGGVCIIINQSCCAYVDQTQRIETDLQAIWEHTKIFHQVSMDDTSSGFTELWKKLTGWLPNFTWLKQLFVACIIVIILFVLICIAVRCVLCFCVTSGESYSAWSRHTLRQKLEHGSRIV